MTLEPGDMATHNSDAMSETKRVTGHPRDFAWVPVGRPAAGRS